VNNNNNNNKKVTKKNSRTNSRKKDKGAGILVFHLPPFAAAVFEAALSHDGPALPAPLSACMRDTSARYFSGVRPADALFGRALPGGGGMAASNPAASSSASSPSTPSSTPSSSSSSSSSSSFTFAEIFAGIGGFRLGLEALGGRCVLSSEIDAPARRTYAANFPTTRDARDARDAATAPRAVMAAAAADVGGSAGGGFGADAVGDVGSGMGGCLQVGSVVSVYAEDVPDFDLLTAGFPCQSFSTRGAQKGLGEERGKQDIRQRRGGGGGEVIEWANGWWCK
jgi:DNA (cytosine-5)-methyltransferase 1